MYRLGNNLQYVLSLQDPVKTLLSYAPALMPNSHISHLRVTHKYTESQVQQFA